MTMTLGDLALLGTSRAGAPAATGTPVDALVDSLTGSAQVADAAQRVLLTAAALDIYQRAGAIPSRIDTLPEPAAADPRPACSATVAAIVSEILAGDHRELLPEAFALIASAGQRVSDPLITSCLDLEEPDLRQAAHAVLGERGRWLARQRDRWSWAAGPAPTASLEELRRTWEEGAIAPRFEAIAQVRAAEPGIAREWMSIAWSGEPVEYRVRLLAIAETGLGPDDEPWLESILKDRSLAVRARAARLLARLPDSAFAARARARVEPLLAWEPTSDRAGAALWTRVKAIATGTDRAAGTLRVLPPAAADSAWEQDGISLKPPKGHGERAHWLSQLLAQVHPAFWSQRFDVAPRELVRAAWQSEWGSAVAIGWSQAVQLHADLASAADDWSAALWDGWATAVLDQDPLAQAARGEMLTRLLASMPMDAAEVRLIAFLRSRQPAFEFEYTSALARFGVPWSESLATVVVDAIEHGQAHLLGPASRFLPASQFDRALAAVLPLGTGLNPGTATRRAVEQFVARIQLRQRLYQELVR